MKTIPDHPPSPPDISGLCAADMAAVISGLQQKLASKEEAFLNQEAKLTAQASALEQRDQAKHHVPPANAVSEASPTRCYVSVLS